MALNLENSGSDSILKPPPSGAVILMQTIEVGELLIPRGENTFGLAVHVASDDVGCDDSMALLQRDDQVFAQSLLTRLEIPPI